MSYFTSAQAINAGLKIELMTPAPDTDTAVAMATGNYKLAMTEDDDGEFTGYALKVDQDYLSAMSISGYFQDTDEFLKFAKDLKDSGATLQLIDDFTGSVTKYTAKSATDNKLIYEIRSGKSTITGRYEISEGVIKIYQKSFKIGEGRGAFINADELIEFVEKCLEDLRFNDGVKRMWARRSYRHFAGFTNLFYRR